MAHGSRRVVLVFVLSILAIAAAAIWLRSGLRCAGFPGGGPTAAELPGPRRPGTLRLATFNVRNFPLDERPEEPGLPYSRRTNICDLEEVLTGLDADVLAFQEIRDSRRFPPILRRISVDRRDYRVVISARGGQHGQRVAIGWDDRVLKAVAPPEEIAELALDPGLRPGLTLTLAPTGGGQPLTVITVHLAAGQDGYPTRLRQYRALAAWAEAHRTGRVVLMGDLNTTGPKRGTVEDELERVDALLGRVGLQRLRNASGCSEYWEGPGRWDGVLEASLLDHILVRGLAPSPVDAWLHCRRAGCAELVSRSGAEDPTFWDVSDHCPLTFELDLAG